nr:MAG TPA: hypothetical protein [Caudoviricetes sp.]
MYERDGLYGNIGSFFLRDFYSFYYGEIQHI